MPLGRLACPVGVGAALSERERDCTPSSSASSAAMSWRRGGVVGEWEEEDQDSVGVLGPHCRAASSTGFFPAPRYQRSVAVLSPN